MSLIQINWNPTDKQLRSFGMVAAIASVLIAILLYVLKGLAIKWCIIFIAAGLLCLICSVFSAGLTRWIYRGLILLTFPIGMVVSFALLVALYYLLIMPVGLLFRLAGRDPLHRKFDSTAKSYWFAHHPADNIKRYFSQF